MPICPTCHHDDGRIVPCAVCKKAIDYVDSDGDQGRNSGTVVGRGDMKEAQVHWHCREKLKGKHFSNPWSQI